MNKTELIKLINSLEIDTQEFYVVSSGALVLRDILEDASDLDIAVSDIGLKQLKEKFNLTKKTDDNDWFKVCKDVEVVCNGPKGNWNFKPEFCNGIYVQNINEYYDYLLSSEREKDKKRIPLVNNYINKTKIK